MKSWANKLYDSDFSCHHLSSEVAFNADKAKLIVLYSKVENTLGA